jgi:hypothetical protein
MEFLNLGRAIDHVEGFFKTQAKLTGTSSWQGRKVGSLGRTWEMTHISFRATMPGDGTPEEIVEELQRQCRPNLPWADEHFGERVSGIPMNPGQAWRRWPWAKNADTFRSGEQFNHNYMERYWPRFAGSASQINQGIRYPYGDLMSVVFLIRDDPTTRQAYLPIFFPEDNSHRDRKPCTLGYHFMIRDDALSIYYPMRSCDLLRHFRDDVYLTARLALWVAVQLKSLDPKKFQELSLGDFRMYVASLHVFERDFHALK